MKIRDKVLIVEDEQNIKNFMSTILAANGFDTLMAGKPSGTTRRCCRAANELKGICLKSKQF